MSAFMILALSADGVNVYVPEAKTQVPPEVAAPDIITLCCAHAPCTQKNKSNNKSPFNKDAFLHNGIPEDDVYFVFIRVTLNMINIYCYKKV